MDKAIAKMMVVVTREMPKLSVRLSVMSVPTTLIMTTDNQKKEGIYLFALNWKNKIMINSTPITTEVPVRPRFMWVLRKSAAVSPTVVHKILIIQKYKVISGTLLANLSGFSGVKFFISVKVTQRFLSCKLSVNVVNIANSYACFDKALINFTSTIVLMLIMLTGLNLGLFSYKCAVIFETCQRFNIV